MGITFPDGMIVLEGPLPGFNMDTIAWRNSQLRIIIENFMNARVLRGDKIYNTCAIITAAWNARYGPVLQWLTNEATHCDKKGEGRGTPVGMSRRGVHL